MPREKVTWNPDRQKIVYEKSHWEILAAFRERGEEIDQLLRMKNIPVYFYGSFARGDVHPTSDIDAFIPVNVPSFQLETQLDVEGFTIIKREIVQATPGDMIKGHLYLPGDICITFPLSAFSEKNLEFYRFGGMISGPNFDLRNRVAGVNKRLELILPQPDGHEVLPLLNNEQLAAEEVGVSLNIIHERMRVLQRRDRVGRTGVFLKREIQDYENFEQALKSIVDSNPLVRKKIRQK